jgi:hypothetical protein
MQVEEGTDGRGKLLRTGGALLVVSLSGGFVRRLPALDTTKATVSRRAHAKDTRNASYRCFVIRPAA